MSMLYENFLCLINGMDNWPKTSVVGFELAPPRTKRQRGRPMKLRRGEPQVRHHENGAESLRRTYILRCRRCGTEGHNRRTCTNDPRVDARTEVRKSSSQATDPSTAATGNRAESSNSRQNQEVVLNTNIWIPHPLVIYFNVCLYVTEHSSFSSSEGTASHTTERRGSI